MSNLINTLIVEDRQYRQWEKEQKNRILAMTNVEKKQKEWHQLFPRMAHDDSYLTGQIF